MKKSFLSLLGFVFIAASAAGPLAAIDTLDTKLLTQPAVSAERLAFVYAMDLWTADLDGHNVRRLTSSPGVESSRRSPRTEASSRSAANTTATPTSSSSPPPAASRSV